MTERSKNHLREFQARLNERLRSASTAGADVGARLGLAIGEQRWLVDLAEAGEIVPVPSAIAPVPNTRDWFRGLVSLRGTLFAVSDLARFAGGAPTPLGKESRLLAVAARLEFNAALLVTRMLGLHNLATMTAAPVQPERPDEPWRGREWLDAEGRRWCELSLAALVGDERFLLVNRQPNAG